MPSIIYSEYDLEEVLSTNNNNNNNNEDERNAKNHYININSNKNKQKFESEEMINALKDIENKINLGENNVIKEENENMEITHYNNIIDQKDEDGNLVNNKDEDREKERDAFSGSSNMQRKLMTPPKQESFLTLTGKAIEINHNQNHNQNVLTEKSNKELIDIRSNNDEKIDSMRNTKTSLMKNSQKNFRSDKSRSMSKNSLQNIAQSNNESANNLNLYIKDDKDMDNDDIN
jgi:hypothetical protein